MQAEKEAAREGAGLAREAEEAAKAVLSARIRFIELKRRATRALEARGLPAEARRFIDTYLPELVRYVVRQEYVSQHSSEAHRRRYLEEATPVLLARARNALAVVSVEAARAAVAEGIPGDAADALLELSRLARGLAERIRPVTRSALWRTWEELRELSSSGFSPLVSRAGAAADFASYIVRDGYGEARRALDRILDSADATAPLINDPDLLVERHARSLDPDKARRVRGYAGLVSVQYDVLLDNAAAILAGDWASVPEVAEAASSLAGAAHGLASVLVERAASGSVYEALGLGEREVKAVISLADSSGVLARIMHPIATMLKMIEHEARSITGGDRRRYAEVTGKIRRYIMLRLMDAALLL